MRGCQLWNPSSAPYPALRFNAGHAVISASIRQPFACIAIVGLLAITSPALSQVHSIPDSVLRNKTEGLLIGTLLGDALGGPIEFWGHPEIQATPHPPKWWRDTNDLITPRALEDAAARLYLREYKYLRPLPEPYGHWTSLAAPGTVTDDSRHKIILLHFLRSQLQHAKFPASQTDYAKAYLSWSNAETVKKHSGYDTLVQQWLGESYKTIQWMLGNRKQGEAYPPERLWNALPTCYGQMALLPLAAVYAGRPDEAYRAAYHLAWFENGFAKDMIGALSAGLANAMALRDSPWTHKEKWATVINAVRNTDPFAYAQVPWSERAVLRWLNTADELVDKAKGSPARLFTLLDETFAHTVKWEAQVPFVVMFACLKICDYQPLAAFQLSIEWGWDHDSYAQLLGAFIGALYGPEIFPVEMRDTVSKRLKLDYDEDLDEWISRLMALEKLGRSTKLFTDQ